MNATVPTEHNCNITLFLWLHSRGPPSLPPAVRIIHYIGVGAQ